MGERQVGALPFLEYRLDPGPGGLHLVAAHEERGIAAHHIEDQPLIGLGPSGLERVGIGEVERRRLEPHAAGAWVLAHQLQPYTFVRLKAHDQAVWLDRSGVAAEYRVRYGAKLNDNLGDALRQALAGAQIERYVGPAPIVDVGLERHERFGARLMADLIGKALDDASIYGARRILAAHDTGRDVAAAHDAQAAQHLDLLVAHGIGGESLRRLDGRQAQELDQMVLHHVAQGPGGIVVGSTAFDADSLGDGDLDMIDLTVVPDGLEERIGESQRHEILHRLFSEIVIDTIDLALFENSANLIVDGLGAFEIHADRLFENDTARWRGQAFRFEPCGHLAEKFGSGGQIKNPDTILRHVEMAANGLPTAITGDVERNIVQAVEKPLLDEWIVIGGAHMLGERLLDPRAIGLIIEFLAGGADDTRLGRELTVTVAMIEGRHQLAHGEIAGAAKNEQFERRDRDDLGAHRATVG